MKYGLIFDDNRQTAEALKASLKIWEISARIVLKPDKAMAILLENSPDIIFLDVNMPGINGFEILAKIKSEPSLKGIPVIFVTTDDQPETAKRAMQGGAQELIIKPVMPELLSAALRRASLL